MEGNPVDLSADPGEPVGFWEEAQPKHAEPMSLGYAWWSGAIRGARRAAFWISPFVALMLPPGLALIHFGLGTGHGFGLPNLVLESLEVLAAVGAAGALFNGFWRLIAVWRGQAVRRGEASGTWAALRRLIRFGSRRPRDGATGEPVRGPSLRGSTWIGIKWAFLILAATSLFLVSLLTFIKSLGLASVFHMNDSAIGSLPNPVILTAGVIGMSAAYAIGFGTPIGFIAGLVRWGWWRLRGRPNRDRPARRSGWFRRSPRMLIWRNEFRTWSGSSTP